VGLTGPIAIPVNCQRTRSCELVGGKGFEPNGPRKGNGVTARQRTIRTYRPSWRQRYTTLPFRFTSDLSSETEPPRDLARCLLASGPKQKRPSRVSP